MPEKSQVDSGEKCPTFLAEPYFEHTNCNTRDYTRIYNHCADVVQDVMQVQQKKLSGQCIRRNLDSLVCRHYNAKESKEKES